MQRVAFKMKLKPGNADEYKRRHDELWPEMRQAIHDAGVSDYAIFLDRETWSLFAVQKLADNNRSEEIPKLPIVRKWWDYMADIMEVNADNSPKMTTLEEMFYLE